MSLNALKSFTIDLADNSFCLVNSETVFNFFGTFFWQKLNGQNPLKRFSIDWANNYLFRLVINWPILNFFYSFYGNSQSSNPL